MTQSRRSSFFTRARNSFFRSGGKRGADIPTLSGSTGAEFEGEAIVTRGNQGLSLFSMLSCTKASNTKLIMIKGSNVFVYSEVDSSCPEYSIPLINQKVQLDGKRDVLLMSGLGDVEFRFRFTQSAGIASRTNFLEVLNKEIAIGSTEVVKKKLGHNCPHSKSVKYANEVGEKTKKNQPELPQNVLEHEKLVDAFTAL